jgi:hypothetical protein
MAAVSSGICGSHANVIHRVAVARQGVSNHHHRQANDGANVVELPDVRICVLAIGI